MSGRIFLRKIMQSIDKVWLVFDEPSGEFIQAYTTKQKALSSCQLSYSKIGECKLLEESEEPGNSFVRLVTPDNMTRLLIKEVWVYNTVEHL